MTQLFTEDAGDNGRFGINVGEHRSSVLYARKIYDCGSVAVRCDGVRESIAPKGIEVAFIVDDEFGTHLQSVGHYRIEGAHASVKAGENPQVAL